VAADVPSQQRRLAERIARVEGGRHLLLFHGSRDDGSWLEADKSTYPFSSDELVAQGFDWVALGHYHAHEIIRDATGRARGAYAGCLSSGGLDESGEKGAIVVSLSDGGAEVEFVGLDTRRTHRVECDLSASEFSDDARARIEAALARAGVGAKDMIHLTLIGRRSRGLDLGFLDQLVGRYFHLTINHSRLLPDVDLTQFPELSEATTVEERFVARLREAVEGGDAGARRALMYGLDALQQGRLDARYEE
jgi:DNA repair exonuclease SbcCD nuclease subunit